jgi:hypothetical protein
MHTWQWTRESGGTLKRGTAARSEAAGPKAQGRAASSRMPEWGFVDSEGLGSPDRCSRGRERIPCSILDSEKLWKGERRKQRTRASVRVGARSACGRAGSVARVSVTRWVAAGCAGAGHGWSPQGSDRSLAGAQKGCATRRRTGFINYQDAESKHNADRPVSVRKWNGIGNELMKAGPPTVGPVRSIRENHVLPSSGPTDLQVHHGKNGYVQPG